MQTLAIRRRGLRSRRQSSLHQEIADGRDEPLRRRMIEDMKVRNLSPVTQRRCYYLHAVAKFVQYFKQSPGRLGLTKVRAYQIHLIAIVVGRLQRRGFGSALLLRRHPGALNDGRAHTLRARAAAAPSDLELRRGGAISCGG